MKHKKLSLAVQDVDPNLAPEYVAALQRCAASPRQKTRKKQPLLWHYDWRKFAERYLRRVFPHAWIYRGGSHIAIHASPPPEPRHGKKSLAEPEPNHQAGRLLAAIVEA